jgi:tRNA nucleotidyltransferase/poly(A) polymerase
LKKFSEKGDSMGVDHAWEKFSREFRFAIVSNASLQERLGSVISGVCHLQRDSFPDERVWDEFRKLMNETTRREARHLTEASTHIITSQMSDEKAKQCLQAAFDIFSQVAKAFGRTEFGI